MGQTESPAQAIAALLPELRVELRRQDTEHPVFHGCWDWHSAVHGHWALLRGAQLLGLDEDQAWVEERLLGSGMAQEFATLRERPDFERPYGRAWLLRLLLCFERGSGNRTLRESGEEAALALQDWLGGQLLGPDVGEYANPCWALLQLHAWAAHVEDALSVEWLRDVVTQRFWDNSLELERDAELPGEFFSRWALQAALVAEVLGDKALVEWLGKQPYSLGAMRPLETLHSAHHLGMNASRAWGFYAAARATGSALWFNAYEGHVEASLALHEDWKQDRRAYTHWVPQFTIYAVALDAEERRA